MKARRLMAITIIVTAIIGLAAVVAIVAPPVEPHDSETIAGVSTDMHDGGHTDNPVGQHTHP